MHQQQQQCSTAGGRAMRTETDGGRKKSNSPLHNANLKSNAPSTVALAFSRAIGFFSRSLFAPSARAFFFFFIYILSYTCIIPTISLFPPQRSGISRACVCVCVCVRRLRRYRSADERRSDINIFSLKKTTKRNEN